MKYKTILTNLNFENVTNEIKDRLNNKDYENIRHILLDNFIYNENYSDTIHKLLTSSQIYKEQDLAKKYVREFIEIKNNITKLNRQWIEIKTRFNSLNKNIKIHDPETPVKNYITNHYLYMSLLLFLLNSNQISLAMEIFDEIKKINPKNKEAYLYIAKNLCKHERYSESILMIKQGIKIGRSSFENKKSFIENIEAELYCELGVVYNEMNDFDNSQKALKHAISLDPKNIRAYRQLTLILIKNNKLNEALKISLESIKIDSDNIDFQYLLGKIYSDIGKSDKSIYWLKQAADKGLEFAQYELGVIYLKGELVKQNIRKARKYFAKANVKGIEIEETMLDLIRKSEAESKVKENIDNLHISINNEAVSEPTVAVEHLEGFNHIPLNQDHMVENKDDVQKEIDMIFKIDQDITFKKYIQTKSKKEALKKDKAHSIDIISADEKKGFYRVSHPNNIKSSLLVKIDEKLYKTCDYIKDFEKVANEQKFVGSKGKQGHKFIGKKNLELKILGSNSKGNQRLWGEIVKDKVTGQKSCILSNHGKHIR